MRALARLGLAEQVAAAGNVVRHLEIRRAGAARRLGLPEVWAGVEWPTISILRPELHRILLDGALRSGGARLAMARGVAAMERTAAPPRVRFIDGTADDYDLVVGADGVHSAVRGSIDAAAAAVSTGLFYLRFATRNVAGLADDVWWTTERADGSYGFIPLGAGRAHCFVQVRSPTDELIAAAEQDEFIARFDPAEPALSDALAARVGSIYRHLAYMVRPVAWGRGACALLGDAAHAVSPTLSEGGSLAI